METKYNGHIHRYVAPIFGETIAYISKLINNNNQILWKLQNKIRFDIRSVHLTSKAGPLIFCIPCIISSCMEEVKIGVIYNTLIDSNGGGGGGGVSISVHMHHRQYSFLI